MPGKRLTREQVDGIEALSNQDLAAESVARLFNVSKRTVNRIWSGKGPNPSETTCTERKLNEMRAHPSDGYKRCPGCGGLVIVPCLVCLLSGQT